MEQVYFHSLNLKLNLPLVITLLFLLLLLLLLSSRGTNGETEAQALLIWKNRLSNSSSLSSWSLTNSTSPCNWFGVLCNTADSVFSLNLSSSQLNGTFAELHFSSLPNLTYLDLSYNYLYGPIPEEIGGLSNLVILYLSRNHFIGSIPRAIGRLKSLTKLNLDSNNLTGGIPAEIGNMTNLEDLNLAYNCLIRKIPQELSGLISLTYLNLSGNSIVGTIPSFIGNLSYLELLDLSRLRLTGQILDMFPDHATIPSSSSTFLPRIKSLLLRNNLLVGTIPSFLCNSPLELLDLSNNWLSGELPQCWWDMYHLRFMNLENNNLSGKIQNSTSTTNHSLQSLHLGNNSFTGEFPPVLISYKKLIVLDLGENMFYGKIPTWIGDNLGLLKILRLRSNMFNGTIPLQLSRLNSLQFLDLANNNLKGSIPHSFKNLSSMAKRAQNVGGNYFATPDNDSICCSFRYCNRRSIYFQNQGLPYSQNRGLVYPKDRGSHDDLKTSSNVARGYIEEQACGPIYGQSQNYFLNYRESIQVIWKGAEYSFESTLALMTGIDLSCNLLSGEIPTELTNLSGLVFLNLSTNHLTGEIPKMIGQLKWLESLDLSNNQLSGPIPYNISMLTTLDTLNLSNNNLRGRIPSGSQLQTFSNLSYIGNDGLCGPPLTKNCSTDWASTLPSSEGNGSGHGDDMIWIYAFIVLGFIFGFWLFLGVLFFKKSWRFAFISFIDSMQVKISRKLKIM